MRKAALTHLGEGAQGLQSPGDCRCESPLAAQGREQQSVLGSVRLIGAVRPPKLLDGLVRRPGQLQRQVHPPPLVLRPPAGFSTATDLNRPLLNFDAP